MNNRLLNFLARAVSWTGLLNRRGSAAEAQRKPGKEARVFAFYERTNFHFSDRDYLSERV